MPDSKLARSRVEDVLSVIHAFENVTNVSELTRRLRPAR
jgi:hypothetical protein